MVSSRYKLSGSSPWGTRADSQTPRAAPAVLSSCTRGTASWTPGNAPLFWCSQALPLENKIDLQFSIRSLSQLEHKYNYETEHMLSQRTIMIEAWLRYTKLFLMVILKVVFFFFFHEYYVNASKTILVLKLPLRTSSGRTVNRNSRLRLVQQ